DVLQLLDLLVQLLDLTLDLLEAGIRLGLCEITHHALDLGGGHPGELQRRERPLGQRAPEPVLTLRQLIAPTLEIVDAAHEKDRFGDHRHGMLPCSPQAFSLPVAVHYSPAARRPADKLCQSASAVKKYRQYSSFSLV